MSKDVSKRLIGKVIQVDRNGSELGIGKLLHVGDDYIAILTNEGIVYYNSDHIKSLSEDVEGYMKINAEVPKEFKKSCNLKGLFESSQYDWIGINRNGPEFVEGILAGLEDDFVVLIVRDAIVRVALFHIKNVRFSYMANSVNNQSSSSSISDESSSSSSSDESSSYESSSSSDESSFWWPSHLD